MKTSDLTLFNAVELNAAEALQTNGGIVFPLLPDFSRWMQNPSIAYPPQS